MATFNLTPDYTVSNDWDVSSGTADEVLSDSTESTHIETNAQNSVCIVRVSNFTAGFDSIDSVRYYVSAFMNRSRADDSDLQVKIENISGTALYTETENIVVNGGAFADYYGTARAEYSTGVPWTDVHLNGLRLQLNTDLEDPPAISYVRITKAHIQVTYTPTVSADNAVFFGTNF
jgi:hypothetical protein